MTRVLIKRGNVGTDTHTGSMPCEGGREAATSQELPGAAREAGTDPSEGGSAFRDSTALPTPSSWNSGRQNWDKKYLFKPLHLSWQPWEAATPSVGLFLISHACVAFLPHSICPHPPRGHCQVPHVRLNHCHRVGSASGKSHLRQWVQSLMEHYQEQRDCKWAARLPGGLNPIERGAATVQLLPCGAQAQCCLSFQFLKRNQKCGFQKKNTRDI